MALFNKKHVYSETERYIMERIRTILPVLKGEKINKDEVLKKASIVFSCFQYIPFQPDDEVIDYLILLNELPSFNINDFIKGITEEYSSQKEEIQSEVQIYKKDIREGTERININQFLAKALGFETEVLELRTLFIAFAQKEIFEDYINSFRKIGKKDRKIGITNQGEEPLETVVGNETINQIEESLETFVGGIGINNDFIKVIEQFCDFYPSESARKQRIEEFKILFFIRDLLSNSSLLNGVKTKLKEGNQVETAEKVEMYINKLSETDFNGEKSTCERLKLLDEMDATGEISLADLRVAYSYYSNYRETRFLMGTIIPFIKEKLVQDKDYKFNDETSEDTLKKYLGELEENGAFDEKKDEFLRYTIFTTLGADGIRFFKELYLEANRQEKSNKEQKEYEQAFKEFFEFKKNQDMNFTTEKVSKEIIALSDEFGFEIFDVASLLLPYVPYRPIGKTERPSRLKVLIMPYLMPMPDFSEKRLNYETLESDYQGKPRIIDDFHELTLGLFKTVSARTVFEKYLLLYMISENSGIPGLKAGELKGFRKFLRDYEFDYRVALRKVPNKYKENVKGRTTIFELLEAYYYEIGDKERKSKIITSDILRKKLMHIFTKNEPDNSIFGQLRNPIEVLDREEINDIGIHLQAKSFEYEKDWRNGQGEEI